MRGLSFRRRNLGLLAVAAVAAGTGLAAHAGGLLVWLERGTVDARFSLRGRRHPPPNVVVVGIDKDSVGSLYPISRRLYARVLEELHAAGARLIVYDIAFDRPAPHDEGASLALYEAARKAAPVVFATENIGPSGQTEVLGGNANLAQIGAQAGASSLLPDGDGVLRHTLDRVRSLPTLAAAVASRTGHPADAAQLWRGWIDFAGPPGTVRNLSFLAVLQGHFDPRAVRGKVVVVGGAVPLLPNVPNTTAGSPMSGPEVQANAIATALSSFPLRSPAPEITVLLIALLAALVPLVGMRRGALGVMLVGLGLLVVWSLATQLAFDAGTVLDYSDPLAALLLGTGTTMVVVMWEEGRERRRLRELFAADAGDVVEQVLRPAGPRPLAPTSIIAGYSIEEVLGRGGMAVVYRATQLALQRPVAIKLIAMERSSDSEFRERFKAESRIAAAIEHPNVIPVYEAGEDDGLLFIAMRLVDGIDLAQLLGLVGALEPARAARIVAQVAWALDAAHAHRLVHRDVKPANVLLTVDRPEHAYLTDFGVARHVGGAARLTRVGHWVGTLAYVAPEQVRGEAVDASADIYSLTGVLYHCLTGQVPFPRESEAATLWAHVSAPPPAPSRLVPDLPGAFDDVIALGMAKEPGERFASGAELSQACARAAGIAEWQPVEATRRAGADPNAEHSAPAAEDSPATLVSETE
jgi:CHASE2 domain-containing sensor protein